MTRASATGTVLLSDLAPLDEQEALSLLRARGDAGGLLLGLCAEAERLVITDLGRSLVVIERLVSLADALDHAPARLRVRCIQAQAVSYSNRFTDALQLLAEAIEIGRSAGESLGVARARLTRMQPLARLGRLEEAVAEGEAARRVFLELGEHTFAARTDVNLGNTRRMMDDPGGALAHFNRARAAFATDPFITAQIDSNCAEAMLDLHDFAGAEAAFELARSAFEATGIVRAAAIVEGNLADLMMRQGRLHAALALYEHARRHMGEVDAPGDLCRLDAEHAEVLAAVGVHHEAVEALKAALVGLRGHKLAWEAARAEAALGCSLMQLGRYEEAEPALVSAAANFRALGHATGAARVDLIRADLLARIRRFADASELAAEAGSALRARPADSAAASLQLAVISAARGDLARAELESTEALRAAEELDLAPLRADVLQLIGRLRRAAGEHPRAARDLLRAVDEVERVRGTLQADRLRAAFLGSRAELYEECFSAHLDLGGEEGVRTAFGIAERAKSRALLDCLSSGPEPVPRDHPVTGEHKLLQELAAARAELSALYAQLDSALKSRQPLRDPEQWRSRMHKAEGRIERAQTRLAEGGRFSRLFADPIGVDAVASMLPPESALIQYFAETDCLSAIIVQRSGAVAARRIASLQDIRSTLERLSLQIGRAVARAAMPGVRAAPPAAAQRELRRLHALLLGPMRRRLAGIERLWVLPYGDLHAVPFHALHTGEVYLLDQCEVLVAPSASVLTGLHRRAGGRDGDGRAVVVGIGEAADEARRIAALLGKSRSVLLLDEDATRAKVMAEAAGAQVLHIASHANFAPVAPLASGIQLADGWLTARDAISMDLGGATVVLSGCDTGRAVVGAGDEVLGLARGFLAAGAASVVMSLWPVHGEITTEMMASAYNQLYAGDGERPGGVAGPLRRAQREMLYRRPHPAAWAPFVTIGAPCFTRT